MSERLTWNQRREVNLRLIDGLRCAEPETPTNVHLSCLTRSDEASRDFLNSCGIRVPFKEHNGRLVTIAEAANPWILDGPRNTLSWLRTNRKKYDERLRAIGLIRLTKAEVSRLRFHFTNTGEVLHQKSNSIYGYSPRCILLACICAKRSRIGSLVRGSLAIRFTPDWKSIWTLAGMSSPTQQESTEKAMTQSKEVEAPTDDELDLVTTDDVIEAIEIRVQAYRDEKAKYLEKVQRLDDTISELTTAANALKISQMNITGAGKS